VYSAVLISYLLVGLRGDRLAHAMADNWVWRHGSVLEDGMTGGSL
jgi:hypothetical protein